MFHVNCSFIQYYGLPNVISKSWKQEISTLHVNEDNNCSLINVLSKSERPSKLVYQTIMEHVAQEPLKCYAKWADVFDEDLNWCLIHQNVFKISNNPKLQYFQFKFTHFLIPTNTFLVKIAQKDSNVCFFCQSYPEKLLHLFWECEKVKQLWIEISTWLNTKLQSHNQVRFNLFVVCFGLLDEPKCLTSIITLLGKKFIFNQKCQDNRYLSISAFKNFVKNYYHTEKSIAIANDTLEPFSKIWRYLFE